MPTTPYVNMLLPIVSSTIGPQWASELNAALTLIDAHDHSSGKGTPVRTAGLYLDQDLDFRGTNPKNARSMRFQLLSSLIGGIDDVCCLYFKGADLYANDAAGNQIQLTSGGGIVGTSGSISGLVSPASVVYTPAAKLFKFYSDSNIWASMQTGPLTVSEAVVGGKGVTISVPTGLSANYGLELPAALPASTLPVSLSAAGLLSTGQITKSQLAAPGQQISASSGTFSTTSTTFVDVTNLTVTLTTSGRPVMVMLQPDGSGSESMLSAARAGATNATGHLQISRDATAIYNARIAIDVTGATTVAAEVPCSSMACIDVPAAGTYTYSVQAKMEVAGIINARYIKLVAFEL